MGRKFVWWFWEESKVFASVVGRQVHATAAANEMKVASKEWTAHNELVWCQSLFCTCHHYTVLCRYCHHWMNSFKFSLWLLNFPPLLLQNEEAGENAKGLRHKIISVARDINGSLWKGSSRKMFIKRKQLYVTWVSHNYSIYWLQMAFRHRRTISYCLAPVTATILPLSSTSQPLPPAAVASFPALPSKMYWRWDISENTVVVVGLYLNILYMQAWKPVDYGHPLRDATMFYAPPSLERVVMSGGAQSRSLSGGSDQARSGASVFAHSPKVSTIALVLLIPQG